MNIRPGVPITHSSARKMTSSRNVVPRSSPQHDQHAQQRGAGQQRQQELAPVLELAQLLLAGQQVGAPQHEGQLGELGRLHLERPDLEPPGRAAGLHPDGQNQQQAQDRDAHQRVGGGAEQGGRGLGRNPHQRQPDGHPEQLLLEPGVRRAAAVQGHRRGRGQDHDQAQRDQQHGECRGSGSTTSAAGRGAPASPAAPGRAAALAPRATAWPGGAGGAARSIIPVSGPAAAGPRTSGACRAVCDSPRDSPQAASRAATPRRKCPGRAR